MILLPAIDLHQGRCVRLFQGDYSTAQVVADDAVETALRFREKGAHWLHMVDLDGAKSGSPENRELIARVVSRAGMQVEVGGGIRSMETAAWYLENGVRRVILGSAALKDPEFVQAAAARWGERVAVGIDAREEMVAVEGWLEEDGATDYLSLARAMEAIGVRTIICTDIAKDGAMKGPNLAMLEKLNRAVSCRVIASGGLSSMQDLLALKKLGVYGAIAGRAVYNGAIDLEQALFSCHAFLPGEEPSPDELERYFEKSELLPAIVQEEESGEVLMLAYMNRESLARSIATGQTWFYSRSRQELWHKGETSGHFQQIVSISADCDEDTLLLRVRQTGAACHTGRHSCFFRKIL